MTVAELIEHLKTLDQDRGIWVCYDGGVGWYEPTPDEESDRDYRGGRIKKGDYIINAG